MSLTFSAFGAEVLRLSRPRIHSFAKHQCEAGVCPLNSKYMRLDALLTGFAAGQP